MIIKKENKNRMITYSVFKLKKKNFKFDCSHRLSHLDYDSPCKNIHGHSYKVNVSIKSAHLDKNGMVIDFSKLKEFQKYLDDYYDHALIIYQGDKELIEFAKKNNQKHLIYNKPTTAENMATELNDRLCGMIDTKFITSITVEVYETENNSASYTISKVLDYNHG
jgi:6-pyruvoyltetrahydropterin/6-carboxytetrahydropterin synthase